MTYEIEIRGSLLDQHLPIGAAYGDAGNKITVPPTVDVEVVAAIDAAEAAGARRLLVVVDSFGGWVASAHAVAARLRRFSREVGPVVAYVVKADSSAPIVALAADYVVLAADGRYLIHGAGGHDRPRTHAATAAAIAAGSGMAPALLVGLMEEPGKFYKIDGADALRWGFADEIGTLERARELAAGAELPETERSRRIARLPGKSTRVDNLHGGEVQPHHGQAQTSARAVQSSESSFDSVRAALYARPTAQTYDLAAGNWLDSVIPAGTYEAVATDGARLVAVGSVCATSDDGGVTWASQTIPAGSYYAVAWVPSLSLFVAVGASVCATSSNGTSWSAQTIPAGTYYGIATNDSVVVAVGASNACASSTNATAWTGRTIPAGSYHAVAWGADVFCAVGTSGKIATSADGSAWTARTANPAGASYAGIVYAGDLARFVAVGAAGYVSTSADGITWDDRGSVYALVNWNAVAWNGYVLVAVGSATSTPVVGPGTVAATSLDGIAWVPRATSAGSRLGVTWAGRRFAAVGSSNAIVSMAV